MDSDILVVGAGPAGLGFAHSMSGSGLKITLLERQSREALQHPGFDGRDIALTHRSVRILEGFGIWGRIAADEKHLVLAAKVLNGNSSYSLDIGADAAGPDHADSGTLGYLVSNHVIRRVLFQGLGDLPDVELASDSTVTGVEQTAETISVGLAGGRTLTARLLIAADSRFSDTRRMLGIAADMHDFGRVCIVCRMTHDEPHDGTAYECFHYGRTLAVLPLSSHESSIVVTASSNEHDRLMGMSGEQFASEVEDRFGNRYGGMRLSTERFAYPLVGAHAKRFFSARGALVGDAAVGMHPVTAHGYNLGLSGADILAEEIRSATGPREDIAGVDVLKRYEQRHLRNTWPMYHGTNGLVKFFTDDRPPARLARRVAMRIANNLPPVKWVIRNKLTERGNGSIFLPPPFRSG